MVRVASTTAVHKERILLGDISACDRRFRFVQLVSLSTWHKRSRCCGSRIGQWGGEGMDIENDSEAESPRKRVNASIPPGNDRPSRRMFSRFERKTRGGRKSEMKKQHQRRLGDTLGIAPGTTPLAIKRSPLPVTEWLASELEP